MQEMFHRGDVLRALREQRGWSQKQLAERAGFNVATINRAEQNKPNVGDEVWAKLAAHFNVSVDWLLTAHAEPVALPGVTSSVTLAGHPDAHPSPPESTMSPHAAAKERLEHFVKSLPPAVAAAIEQGVWRLAFKAQLPTLTAAPPTTVKPES